MRTALYLLALLALPAWAAQTVWKWVDEQGVTHYSDNPVPGAERVEISAGPSRASPSPAPTPTVTARPRQRTAPGPQYTSLAITQPASGETMINTGGRLSVSVQIEPALQAGHTLTVLLNGQPIPGVSPGATQFELKDIPRGEHQLTAVVQDARGQRVQESAAVRFFVRQTSIANPPGARPPPRPRPG